MRLFWFVLGFGVFFLLSEVFLLFCTSREKWWLNPVSGMAPLCVLSHSKCWSAGYISREMGVFVKDVKANAKTSSCWAQKGCGTVPIPKSPAKECLKLWSNALCCLRGSCGPGHTSGIFCLLGFFGEDCIVGLNLRPFFLPVADVQLFSAFWIQEAASCWVLPVLFAACLLLVPAPRLLAGLFREEKNLVFKV